MESSYDSMMAAKSFLPYRMDNLTDWMVKQAEEELNETEEKRVQALAELRRLIAEEKNLDIWTDDSYLLQFLRTRKFEPQRAMEVIRNLYTVFQKFPDVYPKNWDTGPAKSLMELNAGGAYPYRHHDGGVVIFIKPAAWDPEQDPVELLCTIVTGLVLGIAEDPATQVCGVHLVYDAGFKLKHLKAATPRMISLFSKLLRNTLPIRFNGIHVVNEGVFFKYIFSILKLFLSEKIRKRFHFHGSDMKELHKCIPKEILPPEYGGDNINYSAREFCMKELFPFVERFGDMLSKGYF